ncbi:sensor histidine kinase [Geoalkalibacter sp.]|uniref:sensor histidine kinase n=1 Tax=Geoalkalibacter sp. TaxID=3041440 RepID=UPI00272E78FD|nr:sensor histidine kinase [Geoalkalibacter sp.]
MSGGPGAAGAPVVSPTKLALVMALAVFVGETGVHFLLETYRPLGPWTRSLLDAGVLLLALVPVYFLVYRPFWRAREASTGEIRRLSRQILRVAEAERERLARDVHDDAGQYLAALKLAVATLERTPGAERPEIRAQAQRLDQLVDQTRARVHEVVTTLRPPDLERRGLVGALEQLVVECGNRFPQARVHFTSQGCEGRLDAELDTALYRVCQEALCNAVRHGRAGNVEVELLCSAQELRLSVRDDGQGFEVDEPSSMADKIIGGVGLPGMRERLALVGGRLYIDSTQDQGTLIQAVIPLKEG